MLLSNGSHAEEEPGEMLVGAVMGDPPVPLELVYFSAQLLPLLLLRRPLIGVVPGVEAACPLLELWLVVTLDLLNEPNLGVELLSAPDSPSFVSTSAGKGGRESKSHNLPAVINRPSSFRSVFAA